jgi:hypothetical protein
MVTLMLRQMISALPQRNLRKPFPINLNAFFSDVMRDILVDMPQGLRKEPSLLIFKSSCKLNVFKKK